MKKIIHLSDLHVGYKSTASRFRNIVTNIIFLKKPASDYVIVISGDLVDDGTEEGVYHEASAQLERLEDEGFRVLVCPGNHDVGPGAFGYKELLTKWNRHFLNSPKAVYPRLDMIDNMAFIGLNTMEEELGFLDRVSAEGELGRDQLSRLARILARKKVQNASRRVVYMHHHPFDTKLFLHLKDSRKLRKALNGQSVDAILFGHYHEGYIWNGSWGIPCALDAGSSTSKRGAPAPHRVIDLGKRTKPTFYDGKFLRD